MPQNRGSRLAWLCLIVIALGTGFYFRFVNLDKKVYWHDEVFTSLWISGHTTTEAQSELGSGRLLVAEDLWRFQRLNNKKSTTTITTLATENAEHPPLYYLITSLWAQAFGDSARAIRSLSAIISLFVFPLLFWLCRELFESSLTGWIAMALMAVSPFHVLYAREARQYSLLTVAILFSSAAFLHAWRGTSNRRWLLYAVSIPLGLYTHLLFGMVMVAHGIYVFCADLKSVDPRQIRFSRMTARYLCAAILGCITFLPWLVVTTRYVPTSDAAGWFSDVIGVSKLLKRWLFGFGSVFLDTGGPQIRTIYGVNRRLIDLAHVPVALLLTYSIYFIWRQTERSKWLFVLALTATTFLSLALPDLIWGGQRSGVPRYMTASYLGCQIAVAYLFARKIHSGERKRVWRVLFALVFMVGIISCTLSSRTDAWWNKGQSSFNPRAARYINAAENPLVISDFSSYGFGNTFSLARLLKPTTHLQLVGENDYPFTASPASEVLLFSSSELTPRKIESEGRYRVEPIYFPELWRLTLK